MKYNFAIAACFRDELLYLKEWIEYHLLIGTQHFYLSNNDYNKEPANELLKPYVERGLVTVIPNYELWIPQHKGFYELYRIARRETKWLALLDIDEFLFPEKYTLDIYSDIIKSFELRHIAGIGLFWAIFGTNSYVFKVNAPVTQTFFQRAEPQDSCNQIVKLIIRPQERAIKYKGHSFIFKNKVVNTLGFELKPTERNRYNSTDIVWTKLRLNHYPLKSLQEFFQKMKRGNMGKCGHWQNNEFWSKYFAEYNKNIIKDKTMERYKILLENKLL